MRLFALKVPETIPEDTFDRLLHHLPEAGQARVRKFRHEGDAIRSIAGRLLPTYHLRTHNLLDPHAHPSFAHGPRGKPYLTSPALPIDFNTSHEGAYVLLGVVQGEPGALGGGRGGVDVGVDVMDLPKDPNELEEGIGYQLATSERLLLSSTAGTIKAKLLTTLWTIKEAYTKATGDGISFGLERIVVDVGDGRVAGVTVDGLDARGQGWRWAVGSLEGGAYGWAVWWRGEAGHVSEEVKVEEILWGDFVRAFIGNGGPPVA